MKKQEPTKKVNLTFRYWLSKEGQLSGEEILPDEQTVTGEIEVPVSVLKEKVSLNSDGTFCVVNLSGFYNNDYAGLKFDSLQTVEQLYERFINYPVEKKAAQLEKDWQEYSQKIDQFLIGESPLMFYWRDDLLNFLVNKYGNRISDELAAKISAEIERRKKEEAEEKAKKAELMAKEEAKKARIESENLDWIKKNGSDRLKNMVERGYEYRLTYEIERGQQELPDFIYDKDGQKIEFSDRANPSAKALEIETEYLEKYPSHVSIEWGYSKDYDEEMGWYAEDETCSELLWVIPEWSRRGFALFL